ncbi:hypothetical protein DTO282E5_5159 [Paecilomyces variotii]|nr:hypothetical protein DTO282E5_5159 [Paecilomyces variotii]
MTSNISNPTQLPLASILVARFLRSNNYTQTLDAFIREAGLPPNAGQVNSKAEESDGWTIENVIEEKKAFDQTVNFERYGDDEDAREKRDRWSSPAPSKPSTIHTPSSSNLLSVSVQPWERQSPPGETETETDFKSTYIISTGADRRLNLFKTSPDHEAAASFSGLADSPILSHVTLRGGSYQLATTMSGQLLLLRDSEVLHRRKDHTKYVVQVTAHERPDSNTVWIATAGWDGRILIYSLDLEHSPLTVGEPRANIQLSTNPESILFVRHTETGELILLASRRDSTYLYYYDVSSEPSTAVESGEEGDKPYEPRLLGKQNLAPHSNAWVAFSPSYLALSPHDPGLLAVATSTLPHMKVMIVRLLFPSPDARSGGDASEAAPAEPETQVTQAMAALALQNREDAAIMIQANTLAPQTAYSTPQVVWRPDGSGLWVNGDDGVIRGIEAKTGKIVALLKDGHEVGSKIRSIWAGWVDVDGKEEKEEWVVSGGFDKRLIVWKV